MIISKLKQAHYNKEIYQFLYNRILYDQGIYYRLNEHNRRQNLISALGGVRIDSIFEAFKHGNYVYITEN